MDARGRRAGLRRSPQRNGLSRHRESSQQDAAFDRCPAGEVGEDHGCTAQGGVGELWTYSPSSELPCERWRATKCAPASPCSASLSESAQLLPWLALARAHKNRRSSKLLPWDRICCSYSQALSLAAACEWVGEQLKPWS